MSELPGTFGDAVKPQQLPRTTRREPVTKLEHLVNCLNAGRGQLVRGAEHRAGIIVHHHLARQSLTTMLETVS